MILKIQKIREGTQYEGYRLALPKAIIESKGWQNKDFKLELKGEKIILTPVKASK